MARQSIHASVSVLSVAINPSQLKGAKGGALDLAALEHYRARLALTLGATTANYELAYVKKQFV